jgi:hypothetical protein
MSRLRLLHILLCGLVTLRLLISPVSARIGMLRFQKPRAGRFQNE